MAGEALVTVVLMVGPAVLATSLGWPLDEHTDWTWLWQYLRGGRVPDEAVIAALAVALWAVWAVHLAVVALDVIALLRGLVPRVGLVRLVWVLVAGGATATSSHTAAVAAQTDVPVQVPVQSENAADTQGTDIPREQEDGRNDVVDRARNLAYFGFDSAALTPEMKRSLESTVGLISDFGLPGAPVTVTGHTDPVGDPDYNLALSERRAQEVADYLVQHLGEEVEFRVQGVGSAQPPPALRAPYGEHRRVEIAYTLQPPAAASEPAPSAQAQPEEATGTAAEPERVRLDVTTASEQETGPDPVLVGAVAGAAGLGAGYAAGRRRAGGGRARIAASASVPEADDAPAVETLEGPVAEGLLRDDPGGLANGVIDQDGYVLVADTVRVDGRDGLSFTGTHAAGVLRAAVADHGTGPVIATRALLAALGGTDTAFREVQEAADLHGARIASESALLTAARSAADEDEAAEVVERETSLLRVLVVCEASDLEQGQDLRETVAAVPGAVVLVLENRVDQTQAGTALCCEDLDRVRVVTADAEAVRNGARLRYRGPAKAPQEDRKDASVPGQRGDRPEEDEPATPVPTPPVSPGSERTRSRVELRLFSEQLVVEVEGQEVPGLRTVGRTLLAYLALHPHGASGEEIVQTCFGAMDSPQAVSARKNAIASIRSSLRAAIEDPDHHVIVHSNGRYALDPELFSVDLWSFSRVCKEARSLSGEPRVDLLREAVKAHPEKLLSGMEEVWVEPTRKSCIRVVVESLLEIVDETRSEDEKVALLERSCLFDEFNEPLYRRIMEIHVSRGRPEIAHQVYRSLKDKLSLIGEKPSAASKEIVEGVSRTGR